MRACNSIIFIATLMCHSAFAQELHVTGSEDDLMRDPFSRPTAVSVDSSARSPQAQAKVAKASLPKLRALLSAGEQSVVNLDGKTVRVGETYNGYTLEKVGESSATFSIGGRQVVLQLKAETVTVAKDVNGGRR